MLLMKYFVQITILVITIIAINLIYILLYMFYIVHYQYVRMTEILPSLYTIFYDFKYG